MDSAGLNRPSFCGLGMSRPSLNCAGESSTFLQVFPAWRSQVLWQRTYMYERNGSIMDQCFLAEAVRYSWPRRRSSGSPSAPRWCSTSRTCVPWRWDPGQRFKLAMLLLQLHWAGASCRRELESLMVHVLVHLHLSFTFVERGTRAAWTDRWQSRPIYGFANDMCC